MSVESYNVESEAAPFDNETSAEFVTRRFKTTEENKSKQGTVYLNEKTEAFIEDVALRSARWRSVSQFINDAMVYYIDREEAAVSMDVVRESTRRDSEHHHSFTMTPTLFKEINMLVDQAHTPWESRQDFYTAALFCYVNNQMPVVKRR